MAICFTVSNAINKVIILQLILVLIVLFIANWAYNVTL